jgi:hypothetical protein
MSPDWSGADDPVPYANLENPQTLNLYAYVQNNPLSRTDPFGHATDPCNGIPNCVSVTADPPPNIFVSAIILGGHHFVDQAVIKANQAWNSLAGQFFRRLTTGPVKPGGVHSGFPKPARLSQAQIRSIIQKVVDSSEKSMSEWGEKEINEAVEEVRNAGGETEKFLQSIAAENPAARTIQQDTSDVMNAAKGAMQAVQESPAVEEIWNLGEQVYDECGGGPGCIP